jgi:hypothetical protein
MSLVEITITVLVAAVLSFTTYIVFFSNKSSRKSSVSQHATASGSSQLKQAARDILEVEKYNSYTQVAQQDNLFLADGEHLATARDYQDFLTQIDDQWSAAGRYIYGVSLYGRPFMPSEEQLAAILGRGVTLRMTLVDPESQAARDIAVDKCKFSRTIHQQDVLARTLGIDRLDPDILLDRIRDEVTGTVSMLSRIKRSSPKVDVSVRYIDFLPVWKGTIVDGTSACYVVYDVPRMDVPFRWTDDSDLIRYYEQRYVNVFWRQGRDVPL